jgi:hypothetical protein
MPTGAFSKGRKGYKGHRDTKNHPVGADSVHTSEPGKDSLDIF